MADYNYTKADLPDSDYIHTEVAASAMVDKGIEYCRWDELGTNLLIVFTNPLIPDDLLILDAIVAATPTYVNPPESSSPSQFSPIDGHNHDGVNSKKTQIIYSGMSEGLSTTTDDITWQQKLLVPATFDILGRYKISFSAELVSRYVDEEMYLQITVNGIEVDIHHIYQNTVMQYNVVSGFCLVDIPGSVGILPIRINFKSVAGYLIGIQRARIVVEMLI